MPIMITYTNLTWRSCLNKIKIDSKKKTKMKRLQKDTKSSGKAKMMMIPNILAKKIKFKQFQITTNP